nr:hypothetical protein [Helicoverpa armigera nucleopolyhedrovirus]
MAADNFCKSRTDTLLYSSSKRFISDCLYLLLLLLERCMV